MPADRTRFVDLETLEAGLAALPVARSRRVECIVRRPDTGEREVLERAELRARQGLLGDNWAVRGSRRTEDGRAHPDMQLNVMDSRVIALIAGGEDRHRWALAGDQLYLDLELAPAALPPGTRLVLGTATIEITDQPHTGCAKFVERYGIDAMRFVNSPEGRELNLRGVNARVVRDGSLRVGDLARIEGRPPGGDH